MNATPVNPKELFTELAEGDKILFGDREEPVTVYRHVTEDDLDGQVITMTEVPDEAVESIEYDLKHNPGLKRNTELEGGDLITGELTGDEFIIARGPRGGCYLLNQWWSKNGGMWSASVALHRQAQNDNEVWTWENTVTVKRVGNTDVNRDEFDAGGDWIRHTDLDGRVVWTNPQTGEAWDHSEELTGEPVPELEDSPVEILETVNEGDMVQINNLDPKRVTEVVNEDDGPLADGSSVKFDGMIVRVFTNKHKAMYRTEDGTDGDVESVSVS